MSEPVWGVTYGESRGGFLMLGYQKSSAATAFPTRHFDGISEKTEFQ
jgi:hypothetical protein